ncbi:MAG: dUTP diphosphatase [Oscillospiraceae bacterium]|nr:dUTP diphosphatase [Oscillospiraceae bacterium]
MRIRLKKLRSDASLPTAGSPGAAGWDLRACLDGPVEIPPGQTVRVGTGLAIAVPEGYFGAVFARSGLSVNEGLRLANCVGVCDSDYRGEYIIPLYNDSSQPQTVSPGERIAQLVILPCPSVSFEEADTLPETLRGASGFGSTGKE